MKQESEDIKVKIFALDLRRILYIGKILEQNLEDFKRQDIVPYFMKTTCNNQLNSIRRFRNDCNMDGKMLNIIRDDLNREQINDISLLLDEVANIENIEEIIEAIRESKKKITE